MEENILVSVLMTSFNHEKYLPEAIEGVLMQKINFKFELLIHDDASKDNSQAVIRLYEERYPDIIKAVYQTENQFSKHDGSIDRILRKMARGKYIAICEGDDYWTDEYKLQKQIDFLEANSDYMACYANVRCVDDNGAYHEGLNNYPHRKTHTITMESFLDKWHEVAVIGQTATLVYRRSWEKIIGLPECYDKYRANGDEKMSLMFAMLGKVYYMEDCVADHRRVFTGTSWTAFNQGKNMCGHAYMRRKELVGLLNDLIALDDGIADRYRRYQTGRGEKLAEPLRYDGTHILNEMVASAWVYAAKHHKKGDFMIARDLIKQNGKRGGILLILLGKALRKPFKLFRRPPEEDSSA